eukprot:1136136-Pelagomonas_calceolata.AAC.7
MRGQWIWDNAAVNGTGSGSELNPPGQRLAPPLKSLHRSPARKGESRGVATGRKCGGEKVLQGVCERTYTRLGRLIFQQKPREREQHT